MTSVATAISTAESGAWAELTRGKRVGPASQRSLRAAGRSGMARCGQGVGIQRGMATPLAMRSGNPALTADTFRGPRTAIRRRGHDDPGHRQQDGARAADPDRAASYTWNLGVGDPRVPAFMMVGVFGGLVAAHRRPIFKKEWAPITTPIYAALEGLALGGISATFEARYPGIVSQAIFLTFGTLARAAARVPLGPHQSDRELQARRLRGDRRHRARLPAQLRDELLRRRHPDASTRAARSASSSASSWSASRR